MCGWPVGAIDTAVPVPATRRRNGIRPILGSHSRALFRRCAGCGLRIAGSYVTERTNERGNFREYRIGVTRRDAAILSTIREKCESVLLLLASLPEIGRYQKMSAFLFISDYLIFRNQIENMLSRVNHIRISRTSCMGGLKINAITFFASSHFTIVEDKRGPAKLNSDYFSRNVLTK